MKRIYLDNAATTPIAPEVVQVMQDVLGHCYGNPSSIHAHGREAKACIEKARRSVAQWLGTVPAHIFFTSGGTEADNMAIRQVVKDMGIRRVITSPIEHHAVTHTVEELARSGEITLEWLHPDEAGRHSLETLEALLKDQPRTLVSLMHANNEIGSMIDLTAIGLLCRKYDALFHSDTVQTMGHFRFNLSELPVDLITCAAHKFHGPKGVGFLYMNLDRVKLHPFITGGAQERNMRAGTENVYGIAGLAKAMDLAYEDLEGHMAHIQQLRNTLKNGLLALYPNLHINGTDDPEPYLYTILNVCFPPAPDREMFLMKLDIHGISASGGSACSSGSQKGSHVLEGVKAPADRPCVRFSFSRYNTMEEVEEVIRVLAKRKETVA